MSIYPPVQRTMLGLLSRPRMATYETACGADVQVAVDLYRWNLDISMALFESIHYLEVALRNQVDQALTTLAGPGVDWMDAPATVALQPETVKRITTARRQARRAVGTPTHGHIVAELSFGFWTYLFAGNYNRTLWAPALKAAFPTAARTDLHAKLTGINQLRNRIAHHEPIITLDITAEYERILATAELVSPRLGWWIDTTSRVDAVRRQRPTTRT